MIGQKIRGIDGGTGQVEVRARRRYPLELQLSGRVLGEPDGRLKGITVNMSSEGLLFVADRPVPLYSRLQLSLEWPVHSERGERLELIVSATAVRVLGNTVAARIGNYGVRAVTEATPAVLVSAMGGGTSQ